MASPTTYVNVVLADFCFQMFAEMKDVDELLEMIRSTTLTDYIRMDLGRPGVLRFMGSQRVGHD